MDWPALFAGPKSYTRTCVRLHLYMDFTTTKSANHSTGSYTSTYPEVEWAATRVDRYLNTSMPSRCRECCDRQGGHTHY